jgi:hypothetical protein
LAPSPSHPMRTGVRSWRVNGKGVMLTTHLHLMTKLRMWGDIKRRKNNENAKKLRNRIYVGYIEIASVGNIECSSSVCLQPVALISVH